MYSRPKSVTISLDGQAPVDVEVLAVQLAMQQKSITVYVSPWVGSRGYHYVSSPATLVQIAEEARQVRIADMERRLDHVERQAPRYTEESDYRVMRRRVEATQRRLRRIAREAAGAHRSCPVEIIAGDAAPRMTGESWCFRTRGGTRIMYPSAYSRSGWSNMVYDPSTLSVEVGRDWLQAASSRPR